MRLSKYERLTDGYITAGDRAYLIGAQNGGFPDQGWHVPGEMGGLWAHPIKLLDGFWLRVDGAWLTEAVCCTSGPFWTEHEYAANNLRIVRRQFMPDGEPAAVVRYTFRSPGAHTLALRLLARSDLQAVWLAERDGIADGWDHAAYDAKLEAWVVQDDLNPWTAVVGARGSLRPVGRESGRDLWGPEQTRGKGVSVALDYAISLDAGQEAVIEFVLAGSEAGAGAALATFARVSEGAEALWAQKGARYEDMLARSALEIPDRTIGQAWDWVKCNYDWLVRDVPGLGRALGAGAPDYVWFFGCDSTYAIFGNLALGQHEIAVETLDTLRRLSLAWNGENGRVIHEANTLGSVYNPGNTQETPHFAKAVWQTFLWTGDLAFLQRNYPFCKRGVLEWVLGERCRQGDLLPHGYGITEVEGLNLQVIDTAAYTAEGLGALAAMADLLGEPDVAARCRSVSDALRARLEEAFWLENEGLYGDMVATPAQMLPRLHALMGREQSTYNDMARPGVQEAYRALLSRAESAAEPGAPCPWLLKHWVIITPVEAAICPPDRAARVLDRVETAEFTGRWGLYLNGIEQAHVMSISTGALAVAELNYGRVEQGLAYVHAIAESLSLHMPGAIAEMSPDYGCFVQAWSGYGIAWPLAAQVFGLRPNAFERKLVIEPAFPRAWQKAALKGVRIGTNTFDLIWDGQVLTVISHEAGWTVEGRGVALHLATKEETCHGSTRHP